MNAEITKQRSPNAPGVPLEDAINVARKLYAAIRNASVKPDVAAKALGYSGLNGAALTVLGMLSQYGLVERSKGMVKIAPMAITILHPLSEFQKKDAITGAALCPRVFEQLYYEFHECDPAVMENHLIHQGFRPDRAKKVAAVYTENAAFAELKSHSKVIAAENEKTKGRSSGEETVRGEPPFDINLDLSKIKTDKHLPLVREIRLPLDEEHEVELRFYGEGMGAEQLESLSEFLTFMTAQFKRKSPAPPVPSSFPPYEEPEQ